MNKRARNKREIPQRHFLVNCDFISFSYFTASVLLAANNKKIKYKDVESDHKLTFGVVHEIVCELHTKCKEEEIEITLNINNFHTVSNAIML